MVMIRRTKITCPKCGTHITVRDNATVKQADADKVFRAVDEGMSAVDRMFSRIRRILK